jgi:O-antigen/teichoic acid export membrane protein
MLSNSIARNVAATLLQVTITGGAFFVLYRFMYRQLGVEQIGVWSIVLASTSVSRLADLGLSASVVRHVARALGAADSQLVRATIETTVVTLAVLMAVVLLGAYIPLMFVLERTISSSALSLSLEILPYALLSLWVSMLSTVFLGALDGHQRIDLRAVVVTLSVCIYLGLAVVLIPGHGLLGIAYAQLAQSMFLTGVSWLLLRHITQSLPLLPFRWRWSVLRPMIGYGANMQIIGIMSFLFDPVTKLIMGKLGGVASLGYYEMASKVILQLRALVVEANRVVIPVVAAAGWQTRQRETEAARFFLASYRLVFFTAVILFSSLSMLMPAISVLWTGEVMPQLVSYAQLLIIGWFINTLIGPAFFANVSSGRLGQNVRSQAIIGIGGAVFAFVGGVLFHGIGVVTGVTTGLICGSIYLLWRYIRSVGLEWPRALLPQGMILVLVAALAVCVVLNSLALQMSSLNALIAMPVVVLLWNVLCAAHSVPRELIRHLRK